MKSVTANYIDLWDKWNPMVYPLQV